MRYQFRRLSAAFTAALLLFGPAVSLADAPFDGHLVQPPSLGAPERGSVAGPLSSLAFDAADLSRGAFSLPLPLTPPEEHGPLLADVLPSYSPENGLGEWGMGWRAPLEIKRFRPVGEVTFGDADELSGPWGSMRRGDDGAWYPAGVGKPVRLVEEAGGGLRATDADGTVYVFAAADALVTPRGTYAWMLSSVEDLFGERTELVYERNPSGRPFLSRVRYGGRGGERQIELTFAYEGLATPLDDHQSGVKRALDQRVREVSVGVRSGAGYQHRITYRFSYTSSSLGPTFYLEQVDTIYASGQAEPSLRYSYDVGAEALADASLAPVPGLDTYLAEKGPGALSPAAAATADVGGDSLVDVEHASDNGLLRQLAPGQFVYQPLIASGNVDPACRKAPSSTNKPRLLARTSPEADEPQVVAILAGVSSTDIRVCDRSGVLQSLDIISGGWAPGPLKRLVDLNRDGRPDLVRVFSGGYQVATNQSDGQGGATWAVRSVKALTPQFAPQVVWVHDVSGDGVPDLVAPAQGGVWAWRGKGDYAFEEQGEFLGFYTQSGSPVGNVNDSSFTFLDVNADGLTDALLSKSASLALFVNRGDAFHQIDVPAFDDVPPGGAYPLALDLSGSGEEEINFIVNQKAKAVRLTRPSVGLLVSADDGKGTRASFEYGRAAPAPGLRKRPAVLTRLSVASAGTDEVAYDYAYEWPVTHSAGEFLVGFGRATKSGPLADAAVTFHHDDDLSGVVLSAETRDARQPLVRFAQTAYEEADFRGVRLFRPIARDEGLASPGGGAPALTHTDYLDYERGRCPTRTRVTTRHGTLETSVALASVPLFDNGLHCLSSGETLEGRHVDASLDFFYNIGLERNARGQLVRATAEGPAGPLVLQEVAYDGLGRIEGVGSPGHGTTTFAYDAATSLLARVTGPEGFATKVLARDALTGRPQTMRAERGGATYDSFYRYDGLERLAKRWDDLGPSSEASPLETVAYAYATAERPARIETRQRVSAAATREAKSLRGADGDELLSLERFAGGWAASALRRETRSRGEMRALHRPSLGVASDPAALGYADLDTGARELRMTSASALGGELFDRTLLQAGVARELSASSAVIDGAIVTETRENGALPTRRALDDGDRLLFSEDEVGGRTERTYDALGRLVEVRMPGGAAQRQRFDAYGRAHLVERGGLGRIAHSYDVTTGLVVETRHFGAGGELERSIVTTRDAIGRATSEAHIAASTGQKTEFRYDYDGVVPGEPTAPGQLGRRTRTLGEGFEKRTLYRRDGLLAEASVSLAGWRTIRQSYDYYDDGTPKAETWVLLDGAGAEQMRLSKADELDAFGRLTFVRVNGALVAHISYDDEGRARSVRLPGGQTLTYQYDFETRDLRGYSVEGGPWSGGVRWSWNARGLIASETVEADGAEHAFSYSYDDRGFLSHASQANHLVASYSYDTAGLPSSADDVVGGPRDLRRNGPVVDAAGIRYEFDALGRATRKGDLRLAYGPDGQLARAQRAGQAWRFIYDEAGERLLKTDDAGHPLAAFVGGGYLTETSFVLPLRLNGRLVGVLENGIFRSLLADARGTLVSEGGTPNVPTPYGLRATRPRLTVALDYIEKGYDADLGTVRMGVRDYDPFLGQFLTADPLYFGALDKCSASPTDCSLYAYARNNPLRFTDPSGLDPSDPFWTRAGKLASGIAYGTTQALTPLGFAVDVVAVPSHDSDFLFGKAAGNMTTGAAVVASGFVAAGGGAAVSVGSGGVAAVAGAPVAVAGGVAVLEGGATMVAGWRSLQLALSKSAGSGAGGASQGTGSSSKAAPTGENPSEEVIPPAPPRAPGPHPFDGIPRGLHPKVFDIIEDLQAMRAGDSAAKARIAARELHELNANYKGWKSLDIDGRSNPMRFLYKEQVDGIKWMVRNTH